MNGLFPEFFEKNELYLLTKDQSVTMCPQYPLLPESQSITPCLNIENPTSTYSCASIIQADECDDIENQLTQFFATNTRIVDKIVLEKVTLIEPGQNENYPLTDIGNSKLFATVFSNCTRFCTTDCLWYVYNGIKWVQDKTGLKVDALCKLLANAVLTYIEGICGDTRDPLYKKAFALQSLTVRKRIIEDAKSEKSIQIEFNEFNKDPMLLNCRNGTIQLLPDGIVFREHRPSDYITTVASVEYNPNAKSNSFQKFLLEIMRSKDRYESDYELISDTLPRVDYLIRVLGYCLSGKNNEECLFLLYGPKTRNGKSSLVKAVAGVLGDYFNTSSSLLLMKNVYANSIAPDESVVALNGKRFVDIPEPPQGMLLDEAKLKRLCGNDSVTARPLYGKPITFQMTAKMVINTNYLPVVSDASIFSSNRVIVVPFDYYFSPSEIKIELKEIFSSETEKSGILNVLLAGYARQCKKSIREMPAHIVAAIREYRDEADPLFQFINDCINTNTGSNETTARIYACYQNWCITHSIKPDDEKDFVPNLVRHGFEKKRLRTGGGERHMMFTNCRLR